MVDKVTRLNIEHLREQLAAETDPAQREKLHHLLAEAEAKLAASKDGPPEAKNKLMTVTSTPANAWATGRSFCWFAL